MPRLWRETIQAHRREVCDAILDTTAELTGEHGLLNVTMSQVAQETGIGRATLYKYFSSVEEILRTWHERQVNHHLSLLARIADHDAPPMPRLVAVLEAYARIQRHRAEHRTQQHGHELAAFVHRGDQLAPAERQLRDLLGSLLADAATDGQVRCDVSADELAAFCLHALDAARGLPSSAAAERLVTVVVDGLRPRGR